MSLLMLAAARSAKNHSGGTLWTPASLATPPVMWLNDSSTIGTDTNGNCSVWTDVLGGPNRLGQNTLDRNPGINASGQNGRRVLTFNGSQLFGPAGAGLPVLSMIKNLAAASIFVAGNPTKNVGATLEGVFFASVSGSGNTRAGIWLESNQVQAYQRRQDGDSAVGAFITQPDSSWHLMQSEHNWTGQSVAVRLDGGTAVTTATTQGAANCANTVSTAVGLMGNPVVGAQFGAGSIGEIIVLDYIPTTTDRQKIEGYIEWHWGTQANLPAGHPYKTAAPTT